MSTAKILAIVNQFRAQLLAKEEQAEATLNHMHAHTLAAIQPQLNKLYEQMAQKMENGEQIPASWVYQRLRLENTQLLIQQQIDTFSANALQVTRMNQHLGSQWGLQSGMQQLNATIPSGVSYSFGIPSINSLVGVTQAGSPLSNLFNQWGKEAATKVAQALVTGITLGNNPRVVAKSVQDALGISRNRALVISRQEMLRCSKSANLLTYRQNSDVVGQWRWVAAKQGRTCAMCIAMDGTLHDLDEEFESHVQCRCAPVPVTKSWSNILGPLGIDTSGIQETTYVPAQTGIEWFNDQSAAMQQQILGSKAAYDLFKSGQVALSDFIGTDYDEQWGGSRYVKSVKELVGK